MVEKFQTILQSIERQKGSVTLLALLKMDEVIDKWTVIFCAPWATESDRSGSFEFIKQQIIDALTSEEIEEVARIGIFSKTDHLIQELLQYQSGTELKDKSINGNYVYLAQIIKSNSS